MAELPDSEPTAETAATTVGVLFHTGKLTNEKSQILLIEDCEAEKISGRFPWTIPAVSIKPNGETPETAAVRAANQDLGWSINPDWLVKSHGPKKSSLIFTYQISADLIAQQRGRPKETRRIALIPLDQLFVQSPTIPRDNNKWLELIKAELGLRGVIGSQS